MQNQNNKHPFDISDEDKRDERLAWVCSIALIASMIAFVVFIESISKHLHL